MREREGLVEDDLAGIARLDAAAGPQMQPVERRCAALRDRDQQPAGGFGHAGDVQRDAGDDPGFDLRDTVNRGNLARHPVRGAFDRRENL